MPTLVDKVLNVVSGGTTCMVCGRRVSGRDEQLRLRGGDVVHLRCATFNARRTRAGSPARR